MSIFKSFFTHKNKPVSLTGSSDKDSPTAKHIIFRKAKDIRNPRAKIILIASLGIYALILRLTDIGCPIRFLTGLPCPGCGMTRALLCGLRLDLAGAFEHHMMFWSLPIIFLGILFDGRLFKKKTANRVLWILIAAGFVANWVFSILHEIC